MWKRNSKAIELKVNGFTPFLKACAFCDVFFFSWAYDGFSFSFCCVSWACGEFSFFSSACDVFFCSFSWACGVFFCFFCLFSCVCVFFWFFCHVSFWFF